MTRGRPLRRACPGSARRAARAACAVVALAAGAASARAQGGPAEPAPAREVARAVEVLATGAPEARAAAVERLSELAQAWPEAVRAWLGHPDPDVRLNLLHALNAQDMAVERWLRVIVEGRPGDAATYPEALAAWEQLLALTPVPRGPLAAVATRRARRLDATSERYLAVALGALERLLRREATRDDAARLARLLEHDLGAATHELVECFATLPPPLARDALAAVLGGGSPMARARAARVLGEVARPEDARGAARLLYPLLAHASPVVRLAAVRGLDALPLGLGPDDATAVAPAAALAGDRDPDVAAEALRVAGERRIGFAREAAERAVSDPGAPVVLRRQALRTLGQLGQPGAAAALRPHARPDAPEPELAPLAAWALAAVGAPDALPALEALLAQPALSQDERLWSAVARLVPGPGEELLATLLRDGPEGPRRAGWAPQWPARGARAAALAGLGVSRHDAAVALLEGFLLRRAAGSAGAPGRTTTETALALQALVDMGTPAARAALARHLLDGGGNDAALQAVADAGGPDDPALRARLVDHLAQRLEMARGELEPVAVALVSLDPERARAALSRGLARMARGSRDYLGLVRQLGRAGDPTRVEREALPLSRRELEVERVQRTHRQNAYGIDLLYARRYEEAGLEFTRMLWCRTDDSTAAYNVACAEALLDRRPRALRALRRSIRSGWRKVEHMRADPDLDALRAEPGFVRLIARLRLEDETGFRSAHDPLVVR